MQPLDLDRPRDASGIISTAFSTWWHHLGVFVALAALVAFPVTFLVSGLWEGALDNPSARPPIGVQLAALGIWALVAPLVTAMHVLVVLGLSRGEHPTVGAALAAAMHVLPRVLLVTVLYIAVTAVGFALLFVPGVWVAVACYFAAQVAVVEGLRGPKALRRSFELVKGQWWRTFGILVLLSLISAILAAPLGFATQAVGAAADNGPLFVLGSAVAQTVSISFTALASTMLFFDLRARKQLTAAAGAPVANAATAPADSSLGSPERPS